MKMKRYVAASARQALHELREEQGPDAVILSNRRVSGGVEIIAALDYEDALVDTALGNSKAFKKPSPYITRAAERKFDDMDDAERASVRQEIPEVVEAKSAVAASSRAIVPAPDLELGNIQKELKGLRNIMEAPLMQFAWGEMGRIQPRYASILKQLSMLGLSPQSCKKIADKIAENGLHQHSWLEALQLLARAIPTTNDDVFTHGGVIALVGPTGVGKTTTITKLAARYALRHGRRSVALITTDSYRVGAHEQLRTYGRILGVPVQVAADCEELKTVLNHNRERKLILIDTAGVSQRDQRLSEQLATLDIDGVRIKKYLVLSATAQMNLQNDIIKSFSEARLDGCVLTKLDEATSFGEVFSVLIRHKLAIAYISDGQKVPDDLYQAHGKLLVKRAVSLMQETQKTPSEENLAYMFGGMVANAHV